jgi:hypothetical protein
MGNNFVQYGKTEINFSFHQTNRKTLSIEVYPDTTVNIIAPKTASIDEIKTKVLKRASWIVKQQEYFEAFLPRIPEREYISGETHLYLGRRYVLKVKKSSLNSVKLKAGNISVLCNKCSQSKVKQLLTNWYFTNGEKRFNKIFEIIFLSFNSFNLEKPNLEIKRMKNRWGSCTPSKKIILNPELIKAPSKCIEYVITHEICHLIHHNHSKKFYELLSDKMPDWEKWKNRLESF